MPGHAREHRKMRVDANVAPQRATMLTTTSQSDRATERFYVIIR